ncbi:MAG: hypothetical protein II871_08720 [Clostridia bacterium]|nr:hypothetical protein [Clostridia bacterium]
MPSPPRPARQSSSAQRRTFAQRRAIEEKWKRELEMHDLILEIADDLAQGCLMSEYDPYHDEGWVLKYVKAHACK